MPFSQLFSNLRHVSPAPIKTEFPLTRERLAHLRFAIRSGRVSFPSQIPVFARQHRPECQWRIVALYFVHGWSCKQLAGRYHVTNGRVRQVLRHWVAAAVKEGYLQKIPPEELSIDSINMGDRNFHAFFTDQAAQSHLHI